MVVQKVRNKTHHMGFNVLGLFAHESWKFGLFLDIKTLIATVNLKSASSVLKYCLLLDISFYGRAEVLNLHSPHVIQCLGMVCAGIMEILPFLGH